MSSLSLLLSRAEPWYPWTDEFYCRGWRIQHHARNGTYRLVDQRNRPRALGSWEHCRARFEDFRDAHNLRPMSGTLVIVLHGLGFGPPVMQSMANFLSVHSDFAVANVGYAACHGPMARHAFGLSRLLDSLEGVERIHIVAHSMGCIVTRAYLGMAGRGELPQPPDPRIARMVMLGPPNHGAAVAMFFHKLGVLRPCCGTAAWELGPGWHELAPKLATPEFEFGILAGGKLRDRGYCPFLPGDNDFIVTVESTQLAGAADFRVVPVRHAWMLINKEVQERTLRFLDRGCFDESGHRQPLGEAWEAAA